MSQPASFPLLPSSPHPSEDSLPSAIPDIDFRQQPADFGPRAGISEATNNSSNNMETPGSGIPYGWAENGALLAALLDHLRSTSNQPQPFPKQGAPVASVPTPHEKMLMNHIEKTSDKSRPRFPRPGTTDNPRFDGKNATAFLKNFESLIKEYEPEASDGRKIELLEQNTNYNQQSQLTTLEGFEEHDWATFKDSVLAEFLDFDVDRLIGTPAYLEKLCAVHRSENDNLRLYYQQFIQSHSKIKPEELSKYSRTKLLLRGLPYSMAGHIVRKARIKERDTKTFENFNNILRITKEAIESRHDVSRLVHEDTREDMATLVQAMASNQPKLDPTLATKPPVTEADMEVLNSQLSKMMLALMSQNAANLGKSAVIDPGDFDEGAMFNAVIGPELSGKCWYCGESDHFQRECPSFRHLVNLGLCHKAADNKVYFGKAGAYPNPANVKYRWCGKLPRLRYMIPLLEDKVGRKIDFGEVTGWDERRRVWFGHEGNTSATIACMTAEDWDGPEFAVTFAAAQSPKATNSSRPMQATGPPNTSVLKKKAAEQASAARTRTQRKQVAFNEHYDELDFSEDPLSQTQSQPQPRGNSPEVDMRGVDDVDAAVPVAPPHGQKKEKREPKTLRTDKYLRKDVSKGEADLFWLNTMMNSKLDVTFGDVVLYADNATKSIYKRLPNDESAKEALEEYRAKKQREKPYGASAVLADVENEDEEYDKDIPSFNHVSANGLREIDEYPARSASELYKDTSEIDMSAVNTAYIMVPSIWIHAILGARRGTHTVLIDEGAEANLISQKTALALGLPITEGQYLDMNAVNSKIDMMGICQNVRVDVFGVVFFFDFMVSRNPGPTLLGRPWARKVRLHSSNCDDGSWEGTISDAAGKSVVFTGTARPSKCRTTAELMSGSEPTARAFGSGKVTGSRR
jgi:hypothetical protein